jgi:hypothetical protein
MRFESCTFFGQNPLSKVGAPKFNKFHPSFRSIPYLSFKYPT